MDKFRAISGKIRSQLGGKRVESGLADPTAPRRREKGQSFVEMALIVPVLLLLVLGVVEIALFMGRYLDILDLTREAARFASVRDPFALYAGDLNCDDSESNFNFYFHTACIFSPPVNSANCRVADWCPADTTTADPNDHINCFCNGLNPYLVFDPVRDDIVISVYTVSNTTEAPAAPDPQVTNVWPLYPSGKNYWALSNMDDSLPADQENWKKDCDGNLDATKTRHFTEDLVNSMLDASAPPSKGFVAVEIFYCYDQALNAPIISDVIPNPLRLNAYTLMPVPEAAPTPTAMP